MSGPALCVQHDAGPDQRRSKPTMANPFNRRARLARSKKKEINCVEQPPEDDTETFAQWRAKWEFTWKVFVSICAGFGAVLFGVIELLRFAREMGWLQ